MSDPKTDLKLLRREHPELKELVRTSRFILAGNLANKLLRPREAFLWVVLGTVLFAGGIIWLALSLQDNADTPCGVGSSWATIDVNSSAQIKGSKVTVSARIKSGIQQSVTVRTPPHSGQYHIIGVTPDVGMTTGLYTPVPVNGSVTLTTHQILAGSGYNSGSEITSVDVCRQVPSQAG